MSNKSDPDTDSLLVVDSDWHLRYQYFGGEVATRFYNEVRDHQQILGAKCDHCGRVLLPPRGYCEKCFLPISGWEKVGPEGIVRTFTILTLTLEGFPPPPVLIAYVELDGATTSLANYLTGVDLSDVETAGRALVANPPRVRVVFNEEREGTIADFHYEVI